MTSDQHSTDRPDDAPAPAHAPEPADELEATLRGIRAVGENRTGGAPEEE